MTTMWNRVRGLGVGVLLAMAAGGLWSPSVFAQEQSAPPVAPAVAAIQKSDSRYIRTIDDDDNKRIVMQSACRTFVKEDKSGQQVGPSVTMCAAVHIGDKPFYKNLQSLLDSKDVVLFESVKPAGTGRTEHDVALEGKEADEQKAKTTKLRIRVLGIAATAQKAKKGAYPATIEALIEGLNPKMRPYVEGVTTDAWGRPLTYKVVEEFQPPAPAGDDAKPDDAPAPKPATRTIIEITSLGSDNAPGGQGAAADLKLSDQKPIKQAEIPRVETKGLQSQMAEGLGLVFQLDEMVHDHANWRNSDLSIDQVQTRIAGAGGDANELFSTLDGSSFGAGFAKLLFGIMKMMPGIQVIGKVAMMEMLGRADELLESVPQMQHMMDVIIKDRNEVVMGDLARIIETEKNIKTIGIIYGGGHMPDLEKHLAEMGYHEQGVQWLDAIAVDIPKNKQDAKQLDSMRKMVRDSLDQQVKQSKKPAKKKAKVSED